MRHLLFLSCYLSLVFYQDLSIYLMLVPSTKAFLNTSLPAIWFSFFKQPQERVFPVFSELPSTTILLPQSHRQFQYDFAFSVWEKEVTVSLPKRWPVKSSTWWIELSQFLILPFKSLVEVVLWYPHNHIRIHANMNVLNKPLRFFLLLLISQIFSRLFFLSRFYYIHMIYFFRLLMLNFLLTFLYRNHIGKASNNESHFCDQILWWSIYRTFVLLNISCKSTLQ